MFENWKNWKKRREVEQAISENKKSLRDLNNDNDPDAKQRLALQRKLHNQQQLLQIVESRIWVRKARKRLIPVPGPYEEGTWWDSDQEEGGAIPEYALTYWLSDKGKLNVARLIRAANRERIDLVVKVIVALTGLGGTIVGIILALKQR